MDKFTRRALLVGGALLSKVSRPNIVGTSVANITDLEITYSQDLIGQTLRLNVIRSFNGTNQVYEITFDSNNLTDIIEKINSKGRTFVLGQVIDIFKAELTRDVLSITVIDPAADGLEVLNSEAAKVFGFFASPDSRGISLVENWRYSIPGPDKQNLGIGTYLIKHEDRTSESINRAIDSVSRNTEELDRNARNPDIIETATDKFLVYGKELNQFFACVVHQEGTWIEGPLDYIRHQYKQEISNALENKFIESLAQKHFSAEFKYKLALNIIADDVFSINEIRSNIVAQLRNSEQLYTPVKDVLDSDDRTIVLFNEHTNLPEISNDASTTRPWNTKNGYAVIAATNPNLETLDEWGTYSDINVAYNSGITFSSYSAAYAEFVGSFLGPIISNNGKRVTSGVVKDYCTIELSEPLSEDVELRVALESKSSEFIVLTECGVFELNSLSGTQLTVRPWSGDLNKFFLSPNNHFVGSEHLLNPQQEVRVCIFVGRRLPLGMFLAGYDKNDYLFTSNNFTVSIKDATKKIIVQAERAYSNNYLEDTSVKKEEVLFKNLFLSSDPYVLTNTYASSIRNLFSCSTRFVRDDIDLPATNAVIINKNSNNRYYGSNTHRGVNYSSGQLHGFSKNLVDEYSTDLSRTEFFLGTQYRMEHVTPFNLFRLSGIVKNVYENIVNYWKSSPNPLLSPALQIEKFLKTRVVDPLFVNFYTLFLSKIYGDDYISFLSTSEDPEYIPHPSDPEIKFDKVVALHNAYEYIKGIAPYSNIPINYNCSVSLTSALIVSLDKIYLDNISSAYSPSFHLKDIGRVFYLRNAVDIDTAIKLSSIINPRKAIFELADPSVNIGIVFNNVYTLDSVPMKISPSFGIQSSGHSSITHKKSQIIYDMALNTDYSQSNRYACGIPIITETLPVINTIHANDNNYNATNMLETRDLLIPTVAVNFSLKNGVDDSRYPIDLTLTAPIDFIAYSKLGVPSVTGVSFDYLNFNGNIEHQSMKAIEDYKSAHDYAGEHISLWEKLDLDFQDVVRNFSVGFEESIVKLNDLFRDDLFNTPISIKLGDFIAIATDSRYFYSIFYDRMFEYLKEEYLFPLLPYRVELPNEWLVYLAGIVEPSKVFSVDRVEEAKYALIKNLSDTILPPGVASQHTRLKSDVKSVRVSFEMLKSVNQVHSSVFVDDLYPDSINNLQAKAISRLISYLILSGVNISYIHPNVENPQLTEITFKNFVEPFLRNSDSFINSPTYMGIFGEGYGLLNESILSMNIKGNSNKLILNLSNIKYLRDAPYTTTILGNNNLSTHLDDVESGIGTHDKILVNTNISNLKSRLKYLESISVNTNSKRSASEGYSIFNPTENASSIKHYVPRYSKGLRPWYFSMSEEVSDNGNFGVTNDILQLVTWVNSWNLGSSTLQGAIYAKLGLVHKVFTEEKLIYPDQGSNDPVKYYLAQQSVIGVYRDISDMDTADPDFIIVPIANTINREKVLSSEEKLLLYNLAIFLETLNFKHCVQTDSSNLGNVSIVDELTTSVGVLIYPEYITDSTNASNVINFNYRAELLELNSETREALSHFYSSGVDGTTFLSKATVGIESVGDYSNKKQINGSSSSIKPIEINSSSDTFSDSKALVDINLIDNYIPYIRAIGSNMKSALSVRSNSLVASEMSLDLRNSKFLNYIDFGLNQSNVNKSLFVTSYGSWEAVKSNIGRNNIDNDSLSATDQSLLNVHTSPISIKKDNLNEYNTNGGGNTPIKTITSEISSTSGPALLVSNLLGTSSIYAFNKAALASILHKDYLKSRISIKYGRKPFETYHDRKLGSGITNTADGFGYYNQDIEDEYSRPSASDIAANRDNANEIATTYFLGTNKIQGILRISGDTPDSVYDQCNLMASAHLNAGIHGHLNPVESARATKYWSFVSLSQLVAKYEPPTYLKYIINGEEDADTNGNIDFELVNFSPDSAPSNTILDVTVDPRTRFGKSNSPSQLGEKVASYSFSHFFPYREWADHSIEDTNIGPVFVKSKTKYDSDGEIDSGISVNYFVSRDISDPRDGFRFIFSRPNFSLGEASIGRTIVFKLKCTFSWRYDLENNEIPYQYKGYNSPYFEGIIADIVIHDGKNDRSVNTRLGTVEVIVVPSARRFDQISPVLKLAPNLLPKNFFEVDYNLRLLHEGRRIDNYGATEAEWQHGYYYNLLAICESDYENGGRVWAWDYPGVIDDWENSVVTEHPYANTFSITLEGVVHGREWTLNAFQAAISDRLFLLDDLGNRKMSIYARREGDVYIEGNGDNLIFKNWNDIILGEDHTPKKDVSVVVTCAIRRMLRKLTEYEYNNYNDVPVHIYNSIPIYEEEDEYYLVVDEGMYTKMSYDWLVNGVSNSAQSFYGKGLNYTHSKLPESLKGMDIEFNYISQYLGREKQIPTVGVSDRDTMTGQVIITFALSASTSLPNGNDIDQIPNGTSIVFDPHTRFYDQNNVEYRLENIHINIAIPVSPFGLVGPLIIRRVDGAAIQFSATLDLDVTSQSYTFIYPTVYVNLDGEIDTIYNDCLEEEARIRDDYENYIQDFRQYGNFDQGLLDSNFDTLEELLSTTEEIWADLESLETNYNDAVDDNINEVPDLYYFYLDDYQGSFNFAIDSSIGNSIESKYADWEALIYNCEEFIGIIENILLEAEENGLIDSISFDYPSDFRSNSLSATLSYNTLEEFIEDDSDAKQNFADDQGLTISELDDILDGSSTACEDHPNDPDLIEVDFKQSDLIYEQTALIVESENKRYYNTVLDNLGVLTDEFWCNWYGTGDNYYGYPLSSQVTALVESWESETGVSSIAGHTYPIDTWLSNNSSADKFVSIVNRLYRGNKIDGSHEWAYPLAGIINALKYPVITMPEGWDLSKVNVVDLTGTPVKDLLLVGSNDGETMKHRRSAFGLSSNGNVRKLNIDGNYIDGKFGLNEYNESYIKNWSIVDQAHGDNDQYNSFDYTNYSSRQNASNIGRIIYKPTINRASPLYAYRIINQPCFTQQGPGANHAFNFSNVTYSENSNILIQDTLNTGGPFGVLGKVNGTLGEETLRGRSVGLYINFDIEKINDMVGSAHPYNIYGAHWKDKYVVYNFGTFENGNGTVIDEELLDRTTHIPTTGTIDLTTRDSRHIKNINEDQTDNYNNYKIESTLNSKDMCVDAIIKFRIDLELTKKEYNTVVGLPLSRIRNPVLSSSAPPGSTGLSFNTP